MNVAVSKILLVRISLVLVVVATSFGVLAPGCTLSWLRARSVLFDWYLLWNESHSALLDVGHITLFAMLGWCARRALPSWRPVCLVMCLSLFGAASEIAQIWIPGRHARVSDFIADILFSGASVWIARPIRSRPGLQAQD